MLNKKLTGLTVFPLRKEEQMCKLNSLLYRIYVSGSYFSDLTFASLHVSNVHAFHKPFRYGGRSILGGWQLAAPNEIADLVERFERNKLEYKSSTYNEAQTRQEFIDPFFKALG
jgi:hypothetical protein